MWLDNWCSVVLWPAVCCCSGSVVRLLPAPLCTQPWLPYPWFHRQRPQAQAATTALTQEGLAAIIDKLLASREEQQAAAIARHPARGGASSFGIGAVPGLGGPGPASPLPAAGNDSDDGSACSGGRNDTALWEEATAMLRGELVRLGREAAAKMEVGGEAGGEGR